ncbi:MAG: hypothetical protein K2X90_03285 [Candidatus Babeliaceae bacterium]|nr:hypothetical protein [Candidatus Babeliaceae bacterium]
MKKLFILSVVALFAQKLSGKNFQIFNDTAFPLRILWKSNGLGPETRSGKFVLQPGNMCAACIETFDENCVHILYAQTVDGKYKARSKPFCKDSNIIISLQDAKNWKDYFFNKLTIKIEDISSNESLKARL